MEAVPKLPMLSFELKISPVCPDFAQPFKRVSEVVAYVVLCTTTTIALFTILGSSSPNTTAKMVTCTIGRSCNWRRVVR